MKNLQLEQSLMFAGDAGDIESLKSLARQESHRADQMRQALVAVLAATGPVRVPMDNLKNDGGFSMLIEDEWVLLKLENESRIE